MTAVRAAVTLQKDMPGLRLSRDLPWLGLKRLDCLLPGGDLDIARFPAEAVAPLRVHFWRSAEAPFNFPSQLLLLPGGGVSTIALDKLHTLDLGVTAKLVGTVFSRLLGVLGTDEKAALQALNERMATWWRALPPRRKRRVYLRRLSIGPQNLGKRHNPMLRLHGGQQAARASALLPFARKCLEDFSRAIPGGRPLLRACVALQRVCRVMRRGRRDMPYDCPTYKQLRAAATAFFRAWRRAKGRNIPKHHMMYHMVERALRQGNPAFAATYEDESFNKVTKAVFRSAFCQQPEAKTLGKWRLFSRADIFVDRLRKGQRLDLSWVP